MNMKDSQRRLTHIECFEDGKYIQVIHHVLPSSELHSHDFFEIEIISNGKGTHILNSESYPIESDMVWLCTPADFHEIILEEPAEYWTILFDANVLSSEYHQSILNSGAVCKAISPDKFQRLTLATQLLYEEHLTDQNVRPLMEYILDMIIEKDTKSEDTSPIRQAILYTEIYFKNKLTLSSVADQVGLSPTYFGNLFKKEVGETYINYLNKKRVICAMKLLDNGVSVSTACFESGFGSLSGFLHTFKKITGTSPNDYRKKVLEKKQGLS